MEAEINAARENMAGEIKAKAKASKGKEMGKALDVWTSMSTTQKAPDWVCPVDGRWLLINEKDAIGLN